METVTLKMDDLLNGTIIERTIDISNLFMGMELGSKEDQTYKLNCWISNRGNQQHNTILRLKSFKIN